MCQFAGKRNRMRGEAREEREREDTYLLRRGLTAPGARLEVPMAKLLFLVGVLRQAFLERELNQEEDLVNRLAMCGEFSLNSIESSF